MDRPQYVNWIVREDGVVFEDQQPTVTGYPMSEMTLSSMTGHFTLESIMFQMVNWKKMPR